MKIKTKRKIQLTLIPALSGILVGTIATGSMMMINLSKYKTNEQEISDYLEAKTLIDNYYYKEADNSKFMSNALKGMVAGLEDPYAVYMTPEEYSKAQQNLNGTLVGIGVTVQKNTDGKYEIIKITENSPAQKADIKEGDIIVKVMDSSTEGMEFSQLISLIQGEEGTQVSVTFSRNNSLLTKTMTREVIESESVTYKMVDNKIGCIKINAFKGVTPEQFLNAMKVLLEEGAESMIFDLRDNGGGTVDSCEKCLDPLLPEDDVAVAEFKDGSCETICRSDKAEVEMPMIALVNENTASAAELFVCALRDYGKAKLVGINTFGKGIMQNTMPLSNGGALKLTVARYRTTKSECFHEVGLKPDYEVELPEGTYITEIDENNDPQLKKAIELLK